MSDVLALIPARSGSKGIPNKNFTPLAGRSPMNRAIDLCNKLWSDGAIQQYYVSSDIDWALSACIRTGGGMTRCGEWLLRPVELAQDDTPMIAVVQHALREIPGPPDEIICLLQPTQPLRKPAHVTRAIELLRSSGADSVVSVVEIPLTHSPDLVCQINPGGRLYRWGWGWWGACPTRQQARRAYVRDGTVYAFWRRNLLEVIDDGGVVDGGDFYGVHVRPLIIPAHETCPLDTLEDWQRAEERLRERA